MSYVESDIEGVYHHVVCPSGAAEVCQACGRLLEFARAKTGEFLGRHKCGNRSEAAREREARKEYRSPPTPTYAQRLTTGWSMLLECGDR